MLEKKLEAVRGRNTNVTWWLTEMAGEMDWGNAICSINNNHQKKKKKTEWLEVEGENIV